MPKYFNTTESPIVYNDQGKIADGFTWFESDVTTQVRAALERHEIFKLDSDGNVIYDSIEDDTAGEKPLTNENAAKKSTRK